VRSRDAAELELERRVGAAIERDDPAELESAIEELAHHSSEREWAEACCTQLSRHRNAQVRGAAVAGFGHLARRFGQLDAHRVRPRVERALWDRHEFVRSQAESAACDLETYLGWRFERPELSSG
jgi:hypothetical protein